jgi:hypothetical protein
MRYSVGSFRRYLELLTEGCPDKTQIAQALVYLVQSFQGLIPAQAEQGSRKTVSVIARGWVSVIR